MTDKKKLRDIKKHFSYCIENGLTIGVQGEKLLQYLYEQSELSLKQQDEIETLAMAHDTLSKELSLFKEKDKHALIKSNISLSRRVQELEKDIKEWEVVNGVWEEINTSLSKQNKRYREAIERAFNEFKYGDAFNAELILAESLEESE